MENIHTKLCAKLLVSLMKKSNVVYHSVIQPKWLKMAEIQPFFLFLKKKIFSYEIK